VVDGDGDAGILRELRDRVVDGADRELEDDEHRDGEREHRAVHVVCPVFEVDGHIFCLCGAATGL